MSYTNAIYYCDPINGSDTARTALTVCTASNPSGSITNIAKTAHGLVTGAVVDLTLFTAWLNAAWKITVVDANNFTLDAAVWQATADASGTTTPRGGSSKADAWKTYAGGTAARVTAGDTVRIIADTGPTLVGNADWTDNSKNITLASAVNATIDQCENAWTASANVTATADAQRKEGSFASKLVIAAGFTTGLVAYRATGTIDLSGYQQVSFWFRNDNTVAASTLSLRLCTDTAGVTSVHTIPIPAIPSSSVWIPIVVDLAGNMNSAIQSVALYADLDPGSLTCYIDNIVGCKASASADALTHNSLIGKAHNLVWAASTVHASNVIRKPTQPNRNGYCYKVTGGGGGSSGGTEPTWPQYIGGTVVDGALTWTCTALEETWYAIQSIVGTAIKIDASPQSLASVTNPYSGTTETVATYKREPMLPAMATNFSSSSFLNSIASPGSLSARTIISGGWDRTNMTVQDGESWFSLRNGYGACIVFTNNALWTEFRNINAVRGSYGAANITSDNYHAKFKNCHMNNHANEGFNFGSQGANMILEGVRADCNTSQGFDMAYYGLTGYAISACGNSASPYGQLMVGSGARLRDVVLRNGVSGNALGSYDSLGVDVEIIGMISENNASGVCVKTAVIGPQSFRLIKPTINEALIVDTIDTSAGSDEIAIHGLNSDPNDNRIYFGGGSIRSVIDQRHTASGVAWKFLPTTANSTGETRHEHHPLELSIAKILASANVPLNISVWTRRDNTNIKGKLLVRGGIVAGIPVDVSVTCNPTINTWVQSNTLTVTPTESGVIEVLFHVWDGVDITNAYWIDDLSIT